MECRAQNAERGGVGRLKCGMSSLQSDMRSVATGGWSAQGVECKICSVWCEAVVLSV